MKHPIARGRISHPVFTELTDLFQSLYFPLRNETWIDRFEKQVATSLGGNVPIFFPFARTALIAILQVLNLPRGAKVLMPTITIKPMLDVVVHFGLKPILVDVDVSTGCWDVDSLKNASKDKPELALLTYLFGVVPNLKEILPILKENQIVIVEDFSQAFGAKFEGKSLGSLGDFGFCSTSSTKTLDTYGGAIVLVKDKSHFNELKSWKSKLTKPKRLTLVRKIIKNLIRNIATNKLVFSLLTFPAILMINSRDKSEVGKFTGSRSQTPISRIPSLWFEAPTAFQAKVGIRELRLQRKKDERKVEIAARYIEELRTIGPRGDAYGSSVYWQFISLESEAISFRRFLNTNAIDCATTSLVNLSTLKNYALDLHLPESERLYNSGVYLPCYHQLTQAEQSRVIAAVRNYHGQ
jgi:dTDP-4-amino-4,6-dideoxygalactose transaminase